MAVLLYFALTLFTSATLLFFVQPMVGKMILPRLGGTPAVWTTCMVFFQAVLLLGYGYTHFVSTRLPRRMQLALQALVVLCPFLFLPFALGDWKPPEEHNPIFSVLSKLAVMVGVPFFVVSTTAPLLQKWFSHTDHPSAADPYFLYGASNFGSMLALVLYPLWMEPRWAVEEQAVVWTWGYGLFAAFVLGSVGYLYLLWSKHPEEADSHALQPVVGDTATAVMPGDPKVNKVPARTDVKDHERITWMRRLRWVGLAAVPSSLMLGTTTYMTTDIAAIPFFWVLPLALYLVTFILVFARWPVVWTAPTPASPTAHKPITLLLLAATLVCVTIGFVIPIGRFFLYRDVNFLELSYFHGFILLSLLFVFAYSVASGTSSPHDFVLYFQPCFLLFLVLKFVAGLGPPTWLEFTLHLTAFFFTTLMCHGELAKDRPSTRHLTEFFLWMSVGGVVGGLFNALVAPTVFRLGVIEYPLAMILSCFLRPNLVTDVTLFPGDSKANKPTLIGYGLDLVIPIALAAIAYFCASWGERNDMRNFLMAGPIVAVLALAMRPLRFGLALALVWLVVGMYDQNHYRYVFRDRGFFGMVKVREYASSETNSTYHTLIHGGTDHGRQHVRRSKRHEPCAYFHPLTPIGQVFMKLTWPNTPVPPSLKAFDEQVPDDGARERTVAGLVAAGPDVGGMLLDAVHHRHLLFAPGGPNPYHSFTNTNWRLPASVAGVASCPWTALVDTQSEPPFAVVGLGAGTLAAYAKPLQSVDIYEIDPLVYQLSRKVGPGDPPFTYLLDAEKRGANLKVILGDGRLKIEKAPELWYHVICLDAFSSDAIPVHLLTAEAVELYLKKLAPGGVLVFNATNKFVDITGVLRDIADHLDLECWAQGDWYDRRIPEKYSTDFVMLRRNEKAIKALETSFSGGPSLPRRIDRDNWKSLILDMHPDDDPAVQAAMLWRIPPRLGGRLWTDGYSNLLGVLKWGR